MATEKGKIKKILDPESGEKNGKEWTKRMFVIDVQAEKGDYPLAFTCWNNTSEMLNELKVGDPVEVTYNVKSREWQEKWYTDATAIYIKAAFRKVAKEDNDEDGFVFDKPEHKTKIQKNTVPFIVTDIDVDEKDNFDPSTEDNDLPF